MGSCSPKAIKASIMTRVPSLNSPFLLGFDEIERALDRVTRSAGDGYPPYNIERISQTEIQAETLRITLAVAGFTRDQLEILVEDGQLVIRGKQTDDKSRAYLHRGIAARQFQRVFLLADGMQCERGRSRKRPSLGRSPPARTATPRPGHRYCGPELRRAALRPCHTPAACCVQGRLPKGENHGSPDHQ